MNSVYHPTLEVKRTTRRLESTARTEVERDIRSPRGNPKRGTDLVLALFARSRIWKNWKNWKAFQITATLSTDLRRFWWGTYFSPWGLRLKVASAWDIHDMRADVESKVEIYRNIRESSGAVWSGPPGQLIWGRLWQLLRTICCWVRLALQGPASTTLVVHRWQYYRV